jgi:hypothetical protein
MYFQLHRHLLCILLLVRLILPILLYLRFLTTILTAILVCLEHSFWIAQQGFTSDAAFIMAWKFYIDTQFALVAQELDYLLMSKGGNDWFTVAHLPSEEECVEYRHIVLHNLLRKSSSHLLSAVIVDISSARPTIS